MHASRTGRSASDSSLSVIRALAAEELASNVRSDIYQDRDSLSAARHGRKRDPRRDSDGVGCAEILCMSMCTRLTLVLLGAWYDGGSKYSYRVVTRSYGRKQSTNYMIFEIPLSTSYSSHYAPSFSFNAGSASG